MAVDNDPNIVIETAGLTASVATDVATFSGYTAHFQVVKLAHGATGIANIVSSSSPMPVTFSGGLTATVSGFSGPISIQGIASGTAVTVTGTVLAAGITGSPVYVKTFTGSQVEVTGGRYLSKSTDSVSVYGPAGLTYVYTNIVDSSGSAIGVSGGALNVNVVGATINATIPSTVTVVGLSGATAVNVSIGNTANINDTNILLGMTAIYGQVVGLRSDLGGFAVVRPSSFKNGRTSCTTVASQMDSAGFTASAGINIKALSTNTDFVYLGNTSGFLGSSTGYALDPGDNVFLDIKNTDTVWIQAASGTQVITYLAS